MAAHPVTLQLPETLHDHFQSRAERAHRSLEAELLDAVATAAADEEELNHDIAKAIEDLELLTDHDLWQATQNRLSTEARSQLEALSFKQRREKLTRGEKETLKQLVRQYDQAVLLRAEAARLLKERGHDASKLLTAVMTKEEQKQHRLAFRPLFATTGQDTLKALLIVSGGATVAYLTFLGAAFGQDRFQSFGPDAAFALVRRHGRSDVMRYHVLP